MRQGTLTGIARRIHTFFAVSTHWNRYDVFARQKISTFRSSRPAVLELAAKYKDLITRLRADQHPSNDPKEKEEAEKTIFIEMCEICLWGNATDLSLLTSLSYDDIQKLQGAEARKKAEKNILINDLPAAYEVLKQARDKGKMDRRVDIVLDNASFELFVDLILAGYLLASGLATYIVLHPKAMPWFVSDVTLEDFISLLNALQDPQEFFSASDDPDHKPEPLSEKELSDMAFVFEDFAHHHAEGQLIIRPHDFWTTYKSYWELPELVKSSDPTPYTGLCIAELVIFKGDLNYRKLTGDLKWPSFESFETAIGPMAYPTGHMGPIPTGIRTLALRTCKADVVVGLPEGQDIQLKFDESGSWDKFEVARKWAWTGKYAVIQFCDGKLDKVKGEQGANGAEQ